MNDPVVVPQAVAAPTVDIKQREVTHVGSRYEGSVSIATGRREGQGKYIYPNTFFVYEGEWLDGKKHGRGRLSFGEDAGYYEGEFCEGEILGQGSQCWADGAVYTGQFVSGERHGQGSIDRSDGSSYNGAWESNKYSGQGELMLPSGDCYIGNFKGHKYHGKGVLTEPGAGRRYEGFFEAALFHGEGDLSDKGGAFLYKGQFQANQMSGNGKGTDTASGIAYAGIWEANKPTGRITAWDMAVPPASERAGESFLPSSEALREEAADQVNPVDPKAKAKAKAKAASPTPAEEDAGPMLELTAGQQFPEVVLRLVDSENQPVPGESGRRWKVTMFRERKVPKEQEPGEEETIRREVRFGDQRKDYVDPLDAEQEKAAPAAAKGKAPSPPPPPVAGEEDEDAPKPSTGEASMDGAVSENGEVVIGKTEAWLLPAHLQPFIYWLRVEDTTEGMNSESFCQALPPLEFPVRVKASSE